MDQSTIDQPQVDLKQYKCPRCHSELEFAPGTTEQKCKSCGHQVSLGAEKSEQTEIDFSSYLETARDSAATTKTNTATCPSCSAVSAIPQNTTATACPFCGTGITVNGSLNILTPSALLPFKVDERTARTRFAIWSSKLWFAPTDFKKAAYINERFQGIYLPYWTFDSFAKTRYSGQRGDHYYVTENYTETINGKSVSRSRQVQKTRWSAASGSVHNNFNDVLVPASKSLPRNHIEQLEPWDLQALINYDDRFLAGFKAECYSIDLVPGFEEAKHKMAPTIDRTICDDIGGDVQRISSKFSEYSQITFKHILLPIWISACRYRGKVFRFLINGRTGEVQGDRPWSRLKIAAAVCAGIIVLIALFFLAQEYGAS